MPLWIRWMSGNTNLNRTLSLEVYNQIESFVALQAYNLLLTVNEMANAVTRPSQLHILSELDNFSNRF